MSKKRKADGDLSDERGGKNARLTCTRASEVPLITSMTVKDRPKTPLCDDYQDLDEKHLEFDIPQATGGTKKMMVRKKKRLNGGVPSAQMVRDDPDFDPNKVYRCYADGIFDMFHFGHALAFKQVKEMFPNVQMIVGVSTDEDTHNLKGKTVMTEKERWRSIQQCRWVDEIIINPPWVLHAKFLAEHQIDFVCHDAEPYVDASGQSASSGDLYKFVKDLGMFVATQRTDGVSTSDMINRIITQYDEYVKRQFTRGYTRHELNVGWVKEQQIKTKQRINKLDAKIDEMKAKVSVEVEEFGGNMLKFVERSAEFAAGFVKNFTNSIGAALSPPGSPRVREM